MHHKLKFSIKKKKKKLGSRLPYVLIQSKQDTVGMLDTSKNQRIHTMDTLKNICVYMYVYIMVYALPKKKNIMVYGMKIIIKKETVTTVEK